MTLLELGIAWTVILQSARSSLAWATDSTLMAYMKDTLETTPPPTAPIMINTMVDGLEEAGKLEGFQKLVSICPQCFVDSVIAQASITDLFPSPQARNGKSK